MKTTLIYKRVHEDPRHVFNTITEKVVEREGNVEKIYGGRPGYVDIRYWNGNYDMIPLHMVLVVRSEWSDG